MREVEEPAEATRTRLEDFLRHKQGLKLRRKTEANSLWDAGARWARCVALWTSRPSHPAQGAISGAQGRGRGLREKWYQPHRRRLEPAQGSLVGQHPRRHACPSSGDSRGLRLALLPRGRTGLRRAQPRFQARLQNLAPTCARPWTPCWTQPKKSPPEKSRPSSPRAESWSDRSLEPIPKFTAQEEEE